MAQLAIQGHADRCDEVIKILELLGGKNTNHNAGNYINSIYFINSFGYIEATSNPLTMLDFTVLTLEEFLDKYPFKVGDKVIYTKFGDNCDDYPVTIESMEWTGTTIEYTFDGCVTCLAKDLKMWNGEPDAVISGIYLNSCDYADEVELNLGDYEIEVQDGKTYAVKKKPKYPSTYLECCSILKINNCFSLIYDNIDNKYISAYEYQLMLDMDKLRKLIICRNAYWKIAGEQMGLNKPWEPDWKDDSDKYFICYLRDELWMSNIRDCNRFLVFPTKEMRDDFYENFKDLIEECKELL